MFNFFTTKTKLLERDETQRPVKERVEKRYIAVPVYLQDPQPLNKWKKQNSIELRDFLRSETGMLLIELYRIHQVKMMISATQSASEKECGQACGFTMAIDFLEDMSKYSPKNEKEEIKNFRIREKWSDISNVVINGSKKVNHDE